MIESQHLNKRHKIDAFYISFKPLIINNS